MSEKVIERPIIDELKQSYINYAMSVIVSRALPDVRDGLKPVHRRILYALSVLNLTYNRPFKKSATVVGQVIASYHPHGDAAIYDSLVRMAQDFSLRYPLIDGQGNFGSMDGDRAAAHRYTEARMTRICDELLRDLNKETVDFIPNFDESTKEPSVLPSAIPNLLLNGSAGIAVGMATNIPPHNLSEAVEAVCAYIENKEIDLSDLLKILRAPDFPTGGIIHGLEGVREAYRTGRGSFVLRARLDVEVRANKREVIVVTEIPYQVNKSELIKRMAELVKTDVIRGPNEIRDESDRHGVRIVIELKRDVNTSTVINLLYKHTSLAINYSVNAVSLVHGTPRCLSLIEMIRHFYDHRFEVTTRRIRYDLKKAEARIHILEGFLRIALPNLDAIIRTIRESSGVDEAKKQLIRDFDFTSIQAQAVLDLKLSRLVRLELAKLEEELAGLEEAVRGYKDLLTHDEKIDALLVAELRVIKETYGDERRTTLVEAEIVNFEQEDLIHKSDIVVSLTHSGYVKRLPLETYRTQGRGTMGVRGTSAQRDEDAVALLLVANTHDWLFFVTNVGKAYYIRAHELTQGTRLARGSHLKTFIDLGPDEQVRGILRVANWEAETDVLMVTAKGKGKRTTMSQFINAKRSGVRALNLLPEDEVVGLIEIDPKIHKDVMIFTKQGQALRMSLSSMRAMGRAAAGVRVMSLREGDQLIAVHKVITDGQLLCASELGIGKKFDFDQFSAKGRGGLGQRYMRIDEKSGQVCSVIGMQEKSDILFITSGGNIVRISEGTVPLLSRSARGVRLVRLKGENQRVVEAIQADSTLDPSDDDADVSEDAPVVEDAIAGEDSTAGEDFTERDESSSSENTEE